MSAPGSPTADVLMDEVYRRQRHIYDVTRKYFLLGRDTLISRLDLHQEGSVLEIGCGTGRNLIAAARRYPDAKLFGLDVSTVMLATARANIRSAGLEGRIRLALGDATRFDAEALFGRATFDRAFFSYSLSMIPAWRDALREAVATVEPAGGRLLLVDFGGQERLPVWFKRLLRAWLGKFHVTPRAELHAALAELAVSKGGRLDFRPLYRDYAHFAELTR
jgi:S-adenosylmethionine-diacylgycerolhomoserine-N-methlytransferase